jgi:hypothetical protein
MSSRSFVGRRRIGSCGETAEKVDLNFGRSATRLRRGVNERRVYLLLGYAVLLLGVFGLSTARLSAAESSGIRVQAILVWATHVAKTNDASLKELEPDLAKKLSKRLKWDLYYEVKRKEVTVSGKDATHVQISEKCSLDIKHLGEHRIEVHLTGKGKAVSRTVESLAHGHIMALGGDDKNDTGWLIVIRELPAKK